MEQKMTAFQFAADFERKANNKKALKALTEAGLMIATLGFSTTAVMIKNLIVKGAII